MDAKASSKRVVIHSFITISKEGPLVSQPYVPLPSLCLSLTLCVAICGSKCHSSSLPAAFSGLSVMGVEKGQLKCHRSLHGLHFAKCVL